MQIRFRPDLVLQRYRPDGPSLWRSARERIRSLIAFLGSPAQFARIARLSRMERRDVGRMIAPLEHLVRALLMADAIAWLVGTEEGAALMREAATTRDAPDTHEQPTPSRPRPVHAASKAEHASPADRSAATSDASPDEIIARALDPERLAFRLADPLPQPKQTTASTRHHAHVERAKPDAPSATRSNDGLRAACRLEALALVIANPMPMILVLARHLAQRILPPLEIASPHKPMPLHIARDGRDLILARALGFARSLFFHEHRRRIFTYALPAPDPG